MEWNQTNGKPRLRDAAVTQAESGHGEGAERLPPVLQLTLDKILQAIADTKSTLQSQIGSVAMELGLLRADHRSLSERVKSNEGTLGELQPAQKALQMQVDALTN